MVKDLLAISIFGMTLFNPVAQPPTPHVLARHEISLGDRYPVASVNDVFSYNILLTLHDMADDHTTEKDINKSFSYTFTLAPNQAFAFHSDVLHPYANTVVKTTNAHFNTQEGFKSDGYLVGDGVCHFASLINWTAKDAGLIVNAPTNHNFAVIPEIPKEYGVAIYDTPTDKNASEQQNLYITNNRDKSVTFVFDYDGKKLTASVTEEN